MPEVIPVDLLKTRGKLIPPSALPQPPRKAVPGEPPGTPAPSAPSPPSSAAGASTLPEAAENKDAPAAACKMCGYPHDADPKEPTQDDLTEFKRCVWQGETFTRRVDLFGGAVTVVFRVLSPDEDRAIRVAIISESTGGKFSTDPMIANLQMMERDVELRMVFSVSSLRVGGKTVEYPPLADLSVPALNAAHKKLTDQMKSTPVYRAVRSEMAHFNDTVFTIEKRAHDPSFSPATNPVGSSPVPPSPAARG